MASTELEVSCKTLESRRKFQAALAEAGDTGASYFFAPEERARCPPHFDGARYMAGLQTASLGHVLLAAREMESTQTFMRLNNARLGGGLVTVADQQSSGKGRGSNLWTSPDGCLMFTVGRSVKVSGEQAPFINYVVCLALVAGVRDCLAPLLQGAPIDIRIKWPNDVYSGGQKIAGALIHTTYSRGGFNCLTGVGLNVSNREPTRCLDDVLADALTAAGRPPPAPGAAGATHLVRREDVLCAVVNRLDQYFETFETQGFAPLEAQYLEWWLHSGQRVGWDAGADGAQPGSEGAAAAGSAPAAAGAAPQPSAGPSSSPPLPLPQQLTIRGLSMSGFLLAEDDERRQYELTPDGNSLDMMQGMLRRKLP